MNRKESVTREELFLTALLILASLLLVVCA